jgi:hypothetical protein
MTRFTRSRIASINANGGVYTLDYALAANIELSIIELFASTNVSLQKIEVLYSEDNGTTWINPWDAGSDHILQLFLGAGVPASGKPDATWFIGGENHLLRVKITNLHPTSNSEVFFLVKGWLQNR